MRKLAFCIALFCCTNAFAQENDDLARASQPLAEGVPDVAVVRLRALLTTNLPETEQREATLKLAEALIAARRPTEALQTLADPAVTSSPRAKFLRAQAFAGLGRWAEALPLYAESETDSLNAAEARFGEAEALRALGRDDEALEAYIRLTSDPRWSVRSGHAAIEISLARNDLSRAQRLLDRTKPNSASERKERRFLRARFEWQAKHSRRAVDMFGSILKRPQGATHEVLIASLSAIADASIALDIPDSGDDYLEDYIEHRPDDAALPQVFARLDQLYAAERRQSRHELGRWSREEPQPRRALAQWYLARAELRLGRRDAALAAFAELERERPPVPAIARGLIEYAALMLQDGKNDDVRGILATARSTQPPPDVATEIDFMAGQTDYAARQFPPATQTFLRVAHSGPAPKATLALVNATLAAVAAGDAAQIAAGTQELKNQKADETTRGDLALEQGLVAAARGDKNAAETLQKFVREFPKHARISEAWVTLAELAFRATPSRPDEAQQDLTHANAAQPTSNAIERSDYLLVWLEDARTSPNEDRVTELASDFLQKHASSGLAPEVRLKLAETYFRRGDFANAQTQFELLAQQNSTSPMAEQAQFFAAKSAMNTMAKTSADRALVLFDEVVKRNGELKWPARNEQAVIERKLGKPDQALTLYEEVLKGDSKAADKREALCGKGDIYYELGAKDPENYKRAIDYYGQLANDREASPHWHNQAIFKKGMCLEKLNAPADALATFYNIVEEQSRPHSRGEFFWFYKAGFNAARLLEEQSKWQSAAAVYEKLAYAGGARSEEAKSRLDRLRLEHFLWED